MTKPYTLSQLPNIFGSLLTSKTVAFIGDSIWAQNALLQPAAPECFERMMLGLGCPTVVHNLALDGYTFYRANGNAGYLPFGGLSVVQRAINLQPDLIFVALGYNDVMNALDGRSNVQVEADAATLFSTLNTALPNCQIVYVTELGWDSGNFNVAVSLKNKGITPNFFQLKAAGILTGLYTNEILEDAVAAATLTLAQSFQTVDTYIAALPTIQGTFQMNYWRVARLGCTGLDKVHPTGVGSILLAGYVLKGLRATSFAAAMFPNLATQNYPIWEDPDSLFLNELTASGDGWVNAYGTVGETLSKQLGPFHTVYPDTWYLPSKGRLSIQGTLTVNSDVYSDTGWTIQNGQPNSAVSISLDGGAFGSAAKSTDANGYASANVLVGVAALSVGSHTYRYQAGGEVFPPVVYTVSASTEPYLLAYRAANQSAGAGVFTKVQHDNVVLDNRSAMSSGTYTVPVAGKYQVNAAVALGALGNQKFIGLAIFKNGTQFIDGTYTANGSGSANQLNCSVSGVISCAVSDTLDIRAYNGDSGSLNIVGGSNSTATHFTLKWVGW